MLPLLAAITAAGTVASAISNIVGSPSSPAPSTTAPAFDAHLDQVQHASIPNPGADLPLIQNMLALYHAQGSLTADQQMALGRMLMNKTVQLVDSGGNPSTGVVTGYGISQGTFGLVVNGQNQSLSSVQAVLNGVHI